MRARLRLAIICATVVVALFLVIAPGLGKPAPTSIAPKPRPTLSTASYVANDSHLHLTNYIQEGPSLASLIPLMGDQIGRTPIFGIPLQQQWSYRTAGNNAPTYYLDNDADLYYYSFTDAYIAM